MLKIILAGALGLTLTAPASAQTATAAIDLSKPGAEIDRHIYGQFSEHLGTGIYGGIDRNTAVIWQPKAYDVQTQTLIPATTQVTSTSIRPLLNAIMTKNSRGRDYADLIVMSAEHYAAYDAATIAIQRQTNETSLGKLGFSALEYIGGGKRAEIVLDGGIGSNMPANTTFGLNTDSFRIRYHPQRNFDKLFPGDGMQPIDKDAVAQFIGFMGEMTVTNPMYSWRLYDSNPAA